MRETQIDKDRAGEKTRDREATGAKMTWIHRTSIDYLRMKSQRKSSAYRVDKLTRTQRPGKTELGESNKQNVHTQSLTIIAALP